MPSDDEQLSRAEKPSRDAGGRTTLELQGEGDLGRAAEILAHGGLVAFPTETVYGLGADATNGEAVAGIYAAKGRPAFNPLIAHVASLAAAEREAEFPSDARRLAQAFWPGPLTLVLPRGPSCQVSDIAAAGLDTIGLRVPGHPLALRLLAGVGRPVAAPSANRSGHISPTTAAHVRADLAGRIDAILDGGPAGVGLESTILACRDGTVRLLRPGGVAREAIEAVLGRALDGREPASGSRPIAPGLLASHYAPRAKVRLDAETVRPGEAWLGFGADPELPEGTKRLNLSPRGDLVEAAARLFGALREIDALGVEAVAVAPIPGSGLGEAIRDRLRRAAADRPESGA